MFVYSSGHVSFSTVCSVSPVIGNLLGHVVNHDLLQNIVIWPQLQYVQQV